MKKTLLIVMEEDGPLADQTRRLLEAQGLLVRLTRELREASKLITAGPDVVLLTAPFAVAAVRAVLFGTDADQQRVLVVAGPDDSKERMIELMEAGAFSFMRSPDSPKDIAKEMHRIRKLLNAA